MATPSRDRNRQRLFADWGREHAPAVRGYLLAMVRRREVADDLTQEVFCRAWQAWDRYREQGHGRAYLLRIADRLLCDRGRKAPREITLHDDAWRRIEPAGNDEDPGHAASQAEAVEELARAMDRLSADQRRVLLLRYYGQLGFAEIAEQIGCPLGTALSHCRRGLLALREALREKV
jgi:RNA polymerase sigma-70 factor, ECF subfamily